MALNIETFNNRTGGFSFFKAAGHPVTARRTRALLERLAAAGPVAVYDPHGMAAPFGELHDCSALELAGVFVQDLDAIGGVVLGSTSRPITDLAASGARTVLVIAFDAERLIRHIEHLVPDGAEVVSLDAVRIGDDMLTNPRRYLDPINFATNFAFFRDAEGCHTRLVTANYWSGYGASETEIWFCLFDAAGEILAEWREALPEQAGSVVVDSREVRRRFGLGEFTGQLFLHVIGAAGHDVVKYALDTYGESPRELSCTHDANAWPADLYAGLPAPKEDERVVLWVQNSHPCPIPAGAVGLNRMGEEKVAWLQREIPPFGSYALDVAELLPGLRWPAQIEIRAGKHFVRPRYEIVNARGRRRISHPNVERVDLEPDPRIPELANLMGKGYILPAPVLPPERYRSFALPTPMSTAQTTLPLAAIVYDSGGREIARHTFGCLARDHTAVLDFDALLDGALDKEYGHVELVYDFREGGEADGWLHALFRYEDRESGHAAETSFGAHIFNTVLTYRNEPQSYAGPAPGLSTRLFLRLGPPPFDTMCHLIYPASTPWRPSSETRLLLHDDTGAVVAERRIEIPCGGSRLWRYRETFDPQERARAGTNGYVLVRDLTCRLFGYHGLVDGEGGFSFDHMFGF